MESIIVYDVDDPRVLVGHYFVPATEEAKRAVEGETGEWITSIAPTLRELPEDGPGDIRSLPTRLSDGRPAVALAWGDVILACIGELDSDEVTLALDLDFLAAVIGAVCEGRLRPARVLDFHGKIVVALDEAVHGGVLVSRNVDNVLRLAKLKHPAF